MKTIIDREYVPSLWIYSTLDRTDSVFLDSSMENDLGRHSYIGLMPYRKYLPDDSDAIDVLDNIGTDTLMGFIGYDYGMALMGCESRHPQSHHPPFILADFDIIIDDDLVNKVLSIECKGRAMTPGKEMEIVIDSIRSCREPNVPDIPLPRHMESTDEQTFIDSVRKARQLERNGEFYVINLSRRLHVESDADPYDVFLRLRDISPSPFGAFLNIDGMTLISSSMELLLDINDGRAWTRPIKGTSPRCDDNAENEASLKRLLSSDKDRRELLMVTDMERNDLNGFCIPGSVEVNGFFKPEEYATVFHTVADVSGQIEKDRKLGQIVRCMFPGGSIAGAPKRTCIEHIDLLEDSRRGPYTGSIGFFSRERTIMNIMIRTMAYHDGMYDIGVGGGITYESDEELEFDETVQKGKALMAALGVYNGI